MKTYILVAVAALGGIFVVMMLTDNKVDVGGSPVVAVVTDAESVSLPADLPMDIPMYPGAVLDKNNETNTPEERNVNLTLLTPDSVPDVVTWYRGALSINGWAVVDDKNVGGYILLKAEKEDVTVFMQSASLEEGVTAITQRIRIRPTE